MMMKGANSASVVKLVKRKNGHGTKIVTGWCRDRSILDRTNLIDRAINTVKTNPDRGALIVILVLVLFLGNWRAGLIVASAIPLSLLFALALMNLFGVSANLMSLGAIDFGLIVDGAVIIVEATLHYLGSQNLQEDLPSIKWIMQWKVAQKNDEFRSFRTNHHSNSLPAYSFFTGCRRENVSPNGRNCSLCNFGCTVVVAHVHSNDEVPLSFKKHQTQKRIFLIKWWTSFSVVYAPLLKGALKIKYA